MFTPNVNNFSLPPWQSRGRSVRKGLIRPGRFAHRGFTRRVVRRNNRRAGWH